MDSPQLPFPSCVLIDLDNTVYPYQQAHLAGLEGAAQIAEKLLGIRREDFDDTYRTARAQIKRRLGSVAASHSRLLYFQRMLEQLGLGSQVGYALELEQAYWSLFLEAAQLRPQVLDFLDDLRLYGIPSVALTDLTAAIQFRKMLVWRLDRYLDWIVTSEEVGADKPAPEMFDTALAKLGGVEGSVWMIGDSVEADIDGAKSAINAVTIQFLTPENSPSSEADSVVRSFQELRNLLRSAVKN